MHGKICMGKFDTYIPSLKSPSYDIQHTIIMVVVAVVSKAGCGHYGSGL